MLGPTIRLFIKALIIGVIVNMSLQYVSSNPLPYSENATLHKQLPEQAPASIDFQVTSQAEN